MYHISSALSWVTAVCRNLFKKNFKKTRDFACALVSFPDQRTWYLAWEQDYMCACVPN